ncbi:Pentulose/hexulose kinase [Mesotoga infera]|jgi:sugar (pentulose or hexulose) kinase|uniref:Pentulose/hexulose kinase n=1 Tax=Mesotoga infera TaxID=1236046 RepID=A0A7Z7LDY5_9BACT|nr:FGGY family carbohydrate kinase [Mesotoga infera]NLI05538.1 sugar kinase [Thermotogaceae bacterium]SSC12306.1 Pentulose/hexulose kinase [Mesotoga infera]
MKAYLGIDIGTTNMKCLVLGSNGKILEVMHEETPKKRIAGADYLDLEATHSFVDKFISGASGKYSLGGIAFSSIGETVVPVYKGKALSDPLMWYDSATRSIWEKHRTAVDSFSPYRITGVENEYTFSIYKILFQRETLPPNVVEHWLPVASYFAYSLGARPTWDMSLACRSFMIDIHRRCWNSPLLEYIGESPERMGELIYTGRPIGFTQDGVPIVSAGHDHITGLFAARVFARGEEFLFDSMGSASVVAAVIKTGDRNLVFDTPFMSGGTVGVAFEDSQYYIESNLRYYGKLLQSLMNLTGLQASIESYEKLNSEIEKSKIWNFEPLFLVNGDLSVGEGMHGITILEMPITFTREQLIQSAYIYLASSSKLIVDNLEKITGKKLPIICGGGGSLNGLLMKYKASLLEREILVLPTSELTALGGALAAASGVGDVQTVDRCIENLRPLKTEVDNNIIARLMEIFNRNSSRYSTIERERKIKFQEG